MTEQRTPLKPKGENAEEEGEKVSVVIKFLFKKELKFQLSKTLIRPYASVTYASETWT